MVQIAFLYNSGKKFYLRPWLGKEKCFLFIFHHMYSIGLFMVPIFRPFSTHPQLHFWIIFIVWQKNDQKMKQKMKQKMATMNALKCKYLENKAKMHFAYLWQCSAHSNSTPKDSTIFFAQVPNSLKKKYPSHSLPSYLPVLFFNLWTHNKYINWYYLLQIDRSLMPIVTTYEQ